MDVRKAAIEELPAALTVLEGALLDVPDLQGAIDRGDVLVAVEGSEGNERLLGALALEGTEIAAVAVRRRRRDQGIGTALVEAASAERGEVVAEFDRRVLPFWESLGFEIEPLEDDRLRGRWR